VSPSPLVQQTSPWEWACTQKIGCELDCDPWTQPYLDWKCKLPTVICHMKRIRRWTPLLSFSPNSAICVNMSGGARIENYEARTTGWIRTTWLAQPSTACFGLIALYPPSRLDRLEECTWTGPQLQIVHSHLHCLDIREKNSTFPYVNCKR
jgi:hypothetical protein